MGARGQTLQQVLEPSLEPAAGLSLWDWLLPGSAGSVAFVLMSAGLHGCSRQPGAPGRNLAAAAWRGVAWCLGLAGLYYRLQELGLYGFWTDEAWVALCTRVEGFDQFWLSISHTPVLWAASLRLLALIFAAPEFSLRLLPLLFSCLTMWAAYRAGESLVGHALGGILALGVIAFDPLSITYAKILKPYSAEAFLALLAFYYATVFNRSRRAGDLARLTAVLCVGLAFANSQLFLGPAMLASLLLHAVLRRDAQRGYVTAAIVAVGVWDFLYLKLLIAPHLSLSLESYWEGTYVPESGGAAVPFVTNSLIDMLGRSLGTYGTVAAFVGMAALFLFVNCQRTIGLALLALVCELAFLSYMRRVPFSVPRLMLFLLTTLNVCGAAGVAYGARWVWSQRWLRAVAPVMLGLLAYGFVAQHEWRGLGSVRGAEDVGPLVKFLENTRQPNDGVLVYYRSTFVYAYYQKRVPVLLPDGATTVGYVPRLDDPNIVVLTGESVSGAVAKAFAGRERVWFVGSRLRPGDELRIRQQLATVGVTLVETRRERALLLLVRRERG